MIDFNIADYETMPVLPDGKYRATIVSTAVIINKKGNGDHLLLEFRLKNNTTVEHRINLHNDNKKAEAIGRCEFAKLCKCVDIKDIINPSKLHGKACIISVIKVENEYGSQNRVIDYECIVAKQEMHKNNAFDRLDDEIPF